MNVTVGAGAATVTVTLWLPVPPLPVQDSVYVPDVVRLLSVCEPDVDFVPDHAPLAEHDVALMLDQFSVVEPL